MAFYTDAKVSPMGQVNSIDLKSWGKTLVALLAGLIIIYLLQINGTLQNHPLAWVDFIPTQMTQGAIEAQILTAIITLLRKFTNI